MSRLCHTGSFGCKAVGHRACLEVGPVPTANDAASLWGRRRIVRHGLGAVS